MNKITFVTIFGVLLIVLFFVVKKDNRIVMGSETSLFRYSMDDKIRKSELIIIGEVRDTLPSRWTGSSNNDPQDASPEEIAQARGLFTDSVISIIKIIKGDSLENDVRVRSFIGQTEKAQWVNEVEPSFVIEKRYLLFLAKDIGATSKVDPGDYVSLGAYQGVYEITDDKAVSLGDEWVLEELVAYIERTLSTEVETETPIIETESQAIEITPTP